VAGRAAKRRKDREGGGGEEGEGKEEEKREEEEKWASRAKTTTVGHVVAFEYASKYTIAYPCYSFAGFRINYESTSTRIAVNNGPQQPVSSPCCAASNTCGTAYSSLPWFTAYVVINSACSSLRPCYDSAYHESVSSTCCAVNSACPANSANLPPCPCRAYAYSWSAWSTPLRRQRRDRVPSSLRFYS